MGHTESRYGCFCAEGTVEAVLADMVDDPLKKVNYAPPPEDAIIALHAAVGRGDLQVLRRLLEEGVVATDAVDYDRRSALHYAAAVGNTEVASLLLEKGAFVNHEDRWGHTPLDRASEGAHVETQDVLVAAGGSTGQELGSLSPGMCAMGSMMSCRGSIDPAVEAAVSLCCAAAAGAMDLLRELIRGGCDINGADYDGRTALHVSSARGHLEVVKELVGMRAELDKRDNQGLTALRDALKHNHNDIVEFLRTQGAKTSDKGEVKVQADAGSWAIPIQEVELGEQISKTHKSVIYRATWRGTPVVCKTTSRLRPSRIGTTMPEPADNPGARGMFRVYSGNSCSDEELAAAEDELMHEIRLLSTIRHPDLVMFLGACIEYSPPMLLSEFMEGGDLERYYQAQAKKKGQYYRPSTGQLYKWSSAVARALAFLHNCHRPIIHRDLKPMNLLLNSSKEVKVTDFGISKLLEPEVPGAGSGMQTLHSVPKMSGGVGTWRYMAPEVVRYEQYTNRVDVYSLSLIMWFMCTGRQPFMEIFGPDAELVLKAYLRGEEPRPDIKAMKCPTEFRDLVQECWSATPSSRPAAQDCAQRLAAMSI